MRKLKINYMYRYIQSLLIICVLLVQSKMFAQVTTNKHPKSDQWLSCLDEWTHLGKFKLDSLVIDNSEATFYCNKDVSYIPWRLSSIQQVKAYLAQQLDSTRNFDIKVFSKGYELEELVPDYFKQKDQKVLSDENTRNKKQYKFIDGEPIYNKGLAYNHIALWHSHGWYYEASLDRWEWQRARLFGTVEDIFPMTYVLPYLVPMLENAGANVFLPRERCFNTEEVIIDNDRTSINTSVKLNKKLDYKTEIGFAPKDTLFPGDNPFELGTSLVVEDVNGPIATYSAKVNTRGEYAVYVSYRHSKDNAETVKYTVSQNDYKQTIVLNQQMGGGTWAYLGTYFFETGADITVDVEGVGRISLDAVRIGGGMGNVVRRPKDANLLYQWIPEKKKKKKRKTPTQTFAWKTSNRPRYMEASRYWLQYAGMPDSLVYRLNDDLSDYKDDYQSRGEWVGYLMGAPNGPTKYPEVKGLNLPIDLAFAFHTDAGVTPNDSVIGTLGIYSTEREDGHFPNGQSRMESRALTDIIQTQVVDDIRALYNDKWTRRAMWDKQYSEAWRPNVPTMLLELLSHQNIADMRLGLDPHFRFDVSRAIYKGMLKYLAYKENREFVVQPLPVDHLSIFNDKNDYYLSWRSVTDTLEVSSKPTKYKVYTRCENGAFDAGQIVNDTIFTLPKLKFGEIVSFKVTALNDGGESFPSEVLSIGLASRKAPKVLLVNAFDRISPPSFIDKEDFAGIAWWDDQGVPDRFDYGSTGFQYDFNRDSQWLDDDSPGWGASYGNDEGKIIKGNSFDNAILHGTSILKAGYSFVSVSDEAFEDKHFDLSPYFAANIILGEEKTTKIYKGKEEYRIYTPGMMDKLRELTENGQSVFISGAYVGSDIQLTNDSIANDFAASVLRFKWRSNHATKGGSVYSTDYAKPVFELQLKFNTEYHPDIYTVEAPDAIEPVGSRSVTAFRYAENNASAGIMHADKYKTVILGFPFETIVNPSERDALMKKILKFFTDY